MKATLWIGAAALAALFAAGCEDDRALGTERSQDTPLTPPPAAPYQDPQLNPYKGVDVQPPSMNESSSKAKAAPEADKANELTPNDGSNAVDGSNAKMRVVEVQNGEDLSSIPDLNEPIWAP
jgi:hypothetical protein